MSNIAQETPIYFLSHMQRGLARERGADGKVVVSVTLEGARSTELTRNLDLAGPEHVTGLSTSQITRLVPNPASQDFEPNFFAAVEFALPDLPWMFSPSGQVSDTRLAPWMVLAVIEDRPGVRFTEPNGETNGTISIAAPASPALELPDLTESWAWAHVQSEADLAQKSPEEVLEAQPEAFRSRLICPRRLAPLTSYIACVLPAYRGGAQAGMGYEIGDNKHDPAWSGSEQNVLLPVYYAWRFRTARRGGFEAMVRQLRPYELDAGSVALDISDPGDSRLPEDQKAEVTFKGPLVGTQARSFKWDPLHQEAFVKGMAKILAAHKPAAERTSGKYDALRDDPVVAPPLWGAMKIGADRSPGPTTMFSETDWFTALNYHPQHRAAAGLGAEAVRRNQEPLMAEAWSQVADLRKVNQQLNQTRLAAETTKSLRTNKIDTLAPEEAAALASPFKARLGNRFTQLSQVLNIEGAPDGLKTAALNRIGRRKGPIGRKMSLKEPIATATLGWFGQKPDTALKFAEFYIPAGLSDNDFIARLEPVGVPARNLAVISRAIAPEFSSDVRAMIPNTLAGSDAVRAQPVMRISALKRSGTGGVRAGQPRRLSSAQTVSTIAAIARDVDPVFDAEQILHDRLKATLNIPNTAYENTLLPRPLLIEPLFDISGYSMLRGISPDAVMPGVSAVPMDAVGLAEVNTDFVESWLVGANVEMAREFLWREFPAKLDGSYFRRFWDTANGQDDIGPIADWKGQLGQHQVGPGKDGTLVLLIKSDMLARFPNLRIYASKAHWDDRRFRYELVKNGHPEEVRTPLFGGWLNRRTAFFAFDIGLAEAKGTLELMGREPGWFFVFEQPAEGIQFGMDVPEPGGATAPNKWADLNWSHALDAPDGHGLQTHVSIARGVGAENLPYDRDMFRETWGRSASAQARITLQRPARVLMHASGMLP